MKIKVLVAAHKPYEMPNDNQVYIPIFVGSKLHSQIPENYVSDGTGDNISLKNPHFNELTALYWGWKNLDCDALGLVHYRRYLTENHIPRRNLNEILTAQQIENLFQNNDIIVPKKRHYYVESNYEHYIHVHYPEPLKQARRIISQEYPAYLSAFDLVMHRKSAHMFNMFIMKRKPLNAYCTWLFDILFKLEGCIDITGYDKYETRVFGFVSEVLLDVWLEKTKYVYVEEKVLYLEGQNYLKKGFEMLQRKFNPIHD
ncbi:DUF4422 domain-containing protein [Lactiplantibacillus sp. WILCCON 0030]|uniref:DUF4422 domain-containing protein n=1 Tax=Lactiplantibacillus brownii TaxID=3069269 RepID=A0ABU1A935_9LACO|nr:DUF4422 domain-containing protein [Lactiplantibacillus brownii]MDQ7936963.1 DUF4422 domain-containing protein [Lactiplantibacillus brownii]